MALESAAYVNGLVSANPPAGDPVTQADDHLRLIKQTLVASFPSVSGAITKTHTQLNNALDKTGDTMTGLLVLSGAPTVDLNPTTKLYVDTLSVAIALAIGAAMPSGAVIMWSGLVAAIPAGFHLCDGTTGTPDLRNRFVMGAGSTYAPAATGGSKDAVAIAHTHTATSAVTDPQHTHTGVSVTRGGNGGSGNFLGEGDGYGRDPYVPQVNSAATGITVATTVATAGAVGTDLNLPPYMALCYIMKL